MKSVLYQTNEKRNFGGKILWNLLIDNDFSGDYFCISCVTSHDIRYTYMQRYKSQEINDM